MCQSFRGVSGAVPSWFAGGIGGSSPPSMPAAQRYAQFCVLRKGGCSLGGHSKTRPSSLTCGKPLELGHCVRTHWCKDSSQHEWLKGQAKIEDTENDNCEHRALYCTTLHYTILDTMYYILYTVYCILYTIYYILYTICHMLYTILWYSLLEPLVVHRAGTFAGSFQQCI